VNRTAERGPRIFPDGASHDWTLEYDPPAADRSGSIVVSLDGERVSLPLSRDHLAVGAHFNRFGFISTHTDGNGQHVYLDDLTYTWTQAVASK
jgi:hypothetical protein